MHGGVYEGISVSGMIGLGTWLVGLGCRFASRSQEPEMVMMTSSGNYLPNGYMHGYVNHGSLFYVQSFTNMFDRRMFAVHKKGIMNVEDERKYTVSHWRARNRASDHLYIFLYE